MLKFNADEYEITVISAYDQYNDYSVIYDVTIKIMDPIEACAWTQTIRASGDTLESIQRAFRHYLENGWINKMNYEVSYGMGK